MNFYERYKQWVRQHGQTLSLFETGALNKWCREHPICIRNIYKLGIYHCATTTRGRNLVIADVWFSFLITGASGLTWLLPDRFNEQELTLEAIHTAINLISSLHDTIINEPGRGAPTGASELSFALAALQQIEVLVELWAIWASKQGRISNRYDPLIAIEGLKYVLFLCFLHISVK